MRVLITFGEPTLIPVLSVVAAQRRIAMGKKDGILIFHSPFCRALHSNGIDPRIWH